MAGLRALLTALGLLLRWSNATDSPSSTQSSTTLSTSHSRLEFDPLAVPHSTSHSHSVSDPASLSTKPSASQSTSQSVSSSSSSSSSTPPITVMPTGSPPSVPTTLPGYSNASVNAYLAAEGVDNLSEQTICMSYGLASWSNWMFGPMTVETGTSTTMTVVSLGPSSFSSYNTEIVITATGGAGYATDYPFFYNVPEWCCGSCEVYVDKVQILWWPDTPASVPANETSNISDKSSVSYPSTTIYSGHTLTSPTIYIAYTGAWGWNYCQPPGTPIGGGIMPVAQTDLTQMMAPLYTDTTYLKPPPWWFNYTVPINPQTFAGCEGVKSGESFTTTTMDGSVVTGDRCWPSIIVPSQFMGLQPAWATCTGAGQGIWDPPQALIPQPVLLAPTTLTAAHNNPVIPATPAAVQSDPTPSSTHTPTSTSISSVIDTVSTASSHSSTTPDPSQDPNSTVAVPDPSRTRESGPQPAISLAGVSTGPSNPASDPASDPLAPQISDPAAQHDPAASPTVFTIGSNSFTLTAVAATGTAAGPPASAVSSVLALAIGNTTLTAGGHAVTVAGGTVVSLGSSELVVGTRTETFAPLAVTTTGPGGTPSTSVDLGDVILSGLGQVGGATAVAPATAPATGVGEPLIAVGRAATLAGGAASALMPALLALALSI